MNYQYQAAASNPKQGHNDKCRVVCHTKHVIRNVFLIITCNPWNPVAIKKVDPYVEYVTLSGL
jgi:hypothetical protein